jgi:hypothetical protein
MACFAAGRRCGEGNPYYPSYDLENIGAKDAVIWAFGNRFNHEIALYPDQGVAFVEGLGAEVPLATVVRSEWTEERRRR